MRGSYDKLLMKVRIVRRNIGIDLWMKGEKIFGKWRNGKLKCRNN